MKKYILFILLFCSLYTYGQNNSVNKVNISTMQFISNSINKNQNTFKITGDRGLYKFQFNGITDVIIEYHKIGISFPNEEYYFSDSFDEIRKLTSSTKLPLMHFNQNRRLVFINNKSFIDSFILSQFDTSDIQLCRYLLLLTQDYNIEIYFKLKEEYIKTIIFQEQKFFNVYTYTLGWNESNHAKDEYGNELQSGKKNGLLSKDWYDLTDKLLSTMRIY